MLEAVVPLPADRAPRIGQLSALSVVIAIGFYSTTPIFFEAAVEASHPLPQGSVIMLMTFIFNAFSIVILAVPAQSRFDPFAFISRLLKHALVCSIGC